MWSDGVVVAPPLLDDDLHLLQAAEDLPIPKFTPETGT